MQAVVGFGGFGSIASVLFITALVGAFSFGLAAGCACTVLVYFCQGGQSKAGGERKPTERAGARRQAPLLNLRSLAESTRSDGD